MFCIMFPLIVWKLISFYPRGTKPKRLDAEPVRNWSSGDFLLRRNWGEWKAEVSDLKGVSFFFLRKLFMTVLRKARHVYFRKLICINLTIQRILRESFVRGASHRSNWRVFLANYSWYLWTRKMFSSFTFPYYEVVFHDTVLVFP